MLLWNRNSENYISKVYETDYIYPPLQLGSFLSRSGKSEGNGHPFKEPRTSSASSGAFYQISIPSERNKIPEIVRTYPLTQNILSIKIEFYKKCIGGELLLQTVKESPMASKSPAAVQNHIVHSSLTKGALLLMATDMVGPAGHRPGNNVNLSLTCSSEKEINNFYSALSIGGNIIHPIHKSFWSALFGVFTDKFGIEWMLSYERKNQA